MSNILFIGLGNMGYPRAGHLASAGHNVTVFNRTASRAEQWTLEYSGGFISVLNTPLPHIEYVMLCVGRDDDVREILTGSHQLLQQLSAGTLVIDHTTTSALLSEEINQACKERGLLFCDAPVSGGQQGAINGQLSLMTGADSNSLFENVKSITSPYTKAIQHMGPCGAGQKTKMVNQICVAGLVQALSEGMFFAQQSGLDLNQVIAAISQGAAGSWQMVNRHQTMIDGEYEHGFAVNWMHKDLQICLTEAAQMGIELPITQQVDSFYQQLQQMGAGHYDTSSLLYRLQQQNNAGTAGE